MIIYLFSISVFAVILTAYDKYASKYRKRHRIPEKVLLLTGLFGGALAEFISMQIIRHKTRHKKFMIGLPLIMALHIIIYILAHFII
ncbi:MAG: DUF1294 domain-containing protein [Clostridia bacterium]|nr:DUF1294 domain-containing protein [Clostridia bacterium]